MRSLLSLPPPSTSRPTLSAPQLTAKSAPSPRFERGARNRLKRNMAPPILDSCWKLGREQSRVREVRIVRSLERSMCETAACSLTASPDRARRSALAVEAVLYVNAAHSSTICDVR